MQQLPSSILSIPQFISLDHINEIDQLVPLIEFEDGKSTATGAAKLAKNNLQATKQQNPARQRVQEIIFNTLAQSPLTQMAFIPKAILPPIISKYGPGMEYGWHTDSPIMSNGQTIRVDLSITVFLSDPGSYTGGELVIHMPTGFTPFKGNKGDAIIYPTTKLHCVNPVTSGERVAAVTWIQSFIKDTEQREMVFQLKSVQESVAQHDPQSTENLLLLQIYSNMVRMWAEV
jgi:PKHD-type hydroxylase